MTQSQKKQLKRAQTALQNIRDGKRFVIQTRKWIDPIKLNRGRFLTIDGRVTTLRICDALEHRLHFSTADDVQMLCAALRDERKPRRLWLWIWHSDRGVHIIEPAGTDVEALNKDLAERFPNA
jgi:hypothetical protein